MYASGRLIRASWVWCPVWKLTYLSSSGMKKHKWSVSNKRWKRQASLVRGRASIDDAHTEVGSVAEVAGGERGCRCVRRLTGSFASVRPVYWHNYMLLACKRLPFFGEFTRTHPGSLFKKINEYLCGFSGYHIGVDGPLETSLMLFLVRERGKQTLQHPALMKQLQLNVMMMLVKVFLKHDCEVSGVRKLYLTLTEKYKEECLTNITTAWSTTRSKQDKGDL